MKVYFPFSKLMASDKVYRGVSELFYSNEERPSRQVNERHLFRGPIGHNCFCLLIFNE